MGLFWVMVTLIAIFNILIYRSLHSVVQFMKYAVYKTPGK